MASKNPLQIEVYQDETIKHGWRWRMWRSGKVIALGPQGYVKRAQCRRTLIRLIATLSRDVFVWKNGSGHGMRLKGNV